MFHLFLCSYVSSVSHIPKKKLFKNSFRIYIADLRRPADLVLGTIALDTIAVTETAFFTSQISFSVPMIFLSNTNSHTPRLLGTAFRNVEQARRGARRCRLYLLISLERRRQRQYRPQ